MEHFLIYIIVSSLVTLVSVVFAYKPEEEDLKLADFNNNTLEVNKIESAPVYSNKQVKTNKHTVNTKLGATLS
jgi:Na+-transporting NADH:ubiquinone oxidoreductase subunit NqrC